MIKRCQQNIFAQMTRDSMEKLMAKIAIDDLDFEVSPGGVDEPVIHIPVIVVAGVWVIVQETDDAK